MAQHGLSVDQSLVQEGEFSFESGFNLMMKFLSLENPPTALFAGNDEMAMGAIKAAKSKGLRVPEDLSVVGFDDIQFASIFEPALTTVAQPTFDMGQKAMRLLLKLIKDEEIEKDQFILPDKLIVRESCKELTIEE
jgi:LacI family repressor for deo operon, udp, cdd, tsx, nupC, and nupG